MQTRKAQQLDATEPGGKHDDSDPSSLTSYVIEGGVAGRERLRLLSAAMQPLTESFLDRIGIREGALCLDVGCGGGDVTLLLANTAGSSGRVRGVDVDGEVVAIARHELELLPSDPSRARVDFTCADIMALRAETYNDSGNERFDVVYARFFLSHQQNALPVLKHLRTLLKPDGIIGIEDVWFPGHFCHPQCEAFDTFVAWYRATAMKRGADPDIGMKLPSMLLEAGFTHVLHETHTQAFSSGARKLVTLVTLERIVMSIEASGVASESEVETTVRELRDFVGRSDTIVSMAPVVQVIANVS